MNKSIKVCFIRTTFGGPVQKTTQEYQAMIADLVETLIAFVKRHDLSTDEYLQALAFLTEVGRSDEMIPGPGGEACQLR